MKNKTFVIANTKGGVGKSTTAIHSLPLLFLDKKIIIHEIDNNNVTALNNSSLNFSNIKVTEQEKAIDTIDISIMRGKDEINIIDCGGGDDTKNILNFINTRAEFEDLIYLIPTNSNISQFKNTKETIELIRKYDKKSEIYLIFNKCRSLENEELQKQFGIYFGNKDYGVNGRLNEIENMISGYIFIPESEVFEVLSDLNGLCLKDAYFSYQKMQKNLKELKREWLKKGDDYYIKQNNMKRLFTASFELAEIIKKSFEIAIKKDEKNG